MSQLYTFKHEAMMTTFVFRIKDKDPQRAKNAALACIELLDEIENKLSRYIQGSDVWQINHMQADQTLFLSEDCYDCLRIALDAYVQTGGLFDITLGQQIEHKKNEAAGPPPELSGQLMVDPDRPAIHCSAPGREIDLGGIGKGYALDRMHALMKSWGIKDALLAAGGSTQLAFGESPWEIELSGDHSKRILELKNQTLSASGIGIQGSHIISPRENANGYAYPRIWLLNTSAALADAWSTAAMLMKKDELAELAASDVTVYVDQGDAITELSRLT